MFTREFFEDSRPEVLKMTLDFLLGYHSFSMSEIQNGVIKCLIDEGSPQNECFHKFGEFSFKESHNDILGTTTLMGSFETSFADTRTWEEIGTVILSDSNES